MHLIFEFLYELCNIIRLSTPKQVCLVILSAQVFLNQCNKFFSFMVTNLTNSTILFEFCCWFAYVSFGGLILFTKIVPRHIFQKHLSWNNSNSFIILLKKLPILYMYPTDHFREINLTYTTAYKQDY